MSSFLRRQSRQARAVLLDDEEAPAEQPEKKRKRAAAARPAAAPARSRSKKVFSAQGFDDEEEEEGGGERGMDVEEPEAREGEEEDAVEEEAAGAAHASSLREDYEAETQRQVQAEARARSPAVLRSVVQEQQGEPLLLPDGSLLLPDGRRILPDGRTLLPGQQQQQQQQQPEALPLPGAAGEVDGLELAYLREKQALEEDWALECSFQAEAVAAAWEAFRREQQQHPPQGVEEGVWDKEEFYTPGEPLPTVGDPACDPDGDVLPVSVQRDSAQEAQLLAALYPRFRCKISGARAGTQQGLITTLSHSKSVAEAALAALGVPLPYTVEQLREGYLASASEVVRRLGGLGVVVAVAPTEGDESAAASAFTRAWFLPEEAWLG